MTFDYCVIGGGIVGLATAMNILQRRPKADLVVLEKETDLAHHQTGHNSGVIHAGIYYEPGSLKADLCRRGAEATKSFCRDHDIPMMQRGKLLVATNTAETTRLTELEARAKLNDIDAVRLSTAELRREEPNIDGIAALLVRSTGSVDFKRVCQAMAEVVRAAGGQIQTGVEVHAIGEATTVKVTTREEGADNRYWTAKHLVVCGGLQADRLARMAGVRSDARMLPFRGEYYRLPESRRDLVRHLIYPVPDPAMPFLGVHLTPTIDGRVTVGPNAVLGLSREGYRKFSVSPVDVADLLTFSGFWKLASRHTRIGVIEMWNSVFKRGYLSAVRKYCPSLQLSDLLPVEAGIRAQAVLPNGALVHDFLFAQSARTLHVINAPSPAATSAIPIGEMIADRVIGGLY